MVAAKICFLARRTALGIDWTILVAAAMRINERKPRHADGVIAPTIVNRHGPIAIYGDDRSDVVPIWPYCRSPSRRLAVRGK